jgi:uncharacterized protein (DUF58 family)
MRFFRDLYLPRRFFEALAALVVLSAAGAAWGPLFVLAKAGAAALAVGVVADALLLWRGGGLDAVRGVPEKLSNGDPNPVELRVANRYRVRVRARVIDEVPVQFQARGGGLVVDLAAGEERTLRYTLRPTRRGAYRFGVVNLYAESPLGLVLRRFRRAAEGEAAVYPSILQMQRYAFLAASNRLTEVGVKRVRRVGHTMEFERVRAYVPGDDRRTVNWKATARRGGDATGAVALMVNEYEEERAQPVYAVLDMGRTMRSPFEGLTLTDHAINAALVLLNIALLKGDRAGLVTFDEAVRTVIPAERRRSHLPRILEALYRQEPGFLDPDYEGLAAAVRTRLGPRGLVLLFTNFETRQGLGRQLPYLRAIAKQHRLVVVFFENTELRGLLTAKAERAEDVYVKAVAEGLDVEKREIARELERHGIGALLTRPETLTVDAINRYLQLKAQGAI